MRVAPPERLLVVKLEEGLGWKQICAFTGDKIPDVPYPRGNEPRSFETGANAIFRQYWKKWFIQWGRLAVVAAIVGSWVWMAL